MTESHERPKLDLFTRIQVFNRTGGHCWYCGEKLGRGKQDSFCCDHILSPAKGGTNGVKNLVPCCKSCNSAKRSRTIEEFRQYLVCRIHFSDPQIAILEKANVWGLFQDWLNMEAKQVKFWFERNPTL